MIPLRGVADDNVFMATAGVFHELVEPLVRGAAAIIVGCGTCVETDPDVELGGVFTSLESGVAFGELAVGGGGGDGGEILIWVEGFWVSEVTGVGAGVCCFTGYIGEETGEEE